MVAVGSLNHMKPRWTGIKPTACLMAVRLLPLNTGIDVMWKWIDVAPLGGKGGGGGDTVVKSRGMQGLTVYSAGALFLQGRYRKSGKEIDPKT